MSGGGGKGGSQSTQVSFPPWLDAASQDAVQRGQRISEIGYIPYEGPDVAALAPQQIAAMQGTNSAASAMGLPTAAPGAGLPAPQTFAGGIQGYSGAPMANQLIEDFRANRPGQAGLMDSFFVDPFSPYSPNNGTTGTPQPFTYGNNVHPSDRPFMPTDPQNWEWNF